MSSVKLNMKKYVVTSPEISLDKSHYISVVHRQSLLFGHTRILVVFLSSGAESRRPFIRSEYVLHFFYFQILQDDLPELNG